MKAHVRTGQDADRYLVFYLHALLQIDRFDNCSVELIQEPGLGSGKRPPREEVRNIPFAESTQLEWCVFTHVGRIRCFFLCIVFWHVFINS